ncbi:MAG: hypothetical protein ACI8Q1_002225 [Parvicella sp.]|jgi:hypothetical protein
MEIAENMYSGLGKIMLSIAMADGKIDFEEIKSLENNVKKVSKIENVDLILTEIVFKNHKYYIDSSSENLLKAGMKEFHLGDHHLTSKLARIFKELVVDIANAKPPLTSTEKSLLLTFLNFLNERELSESHG